MISLGILLVANRPNSADSGAMQPVQLNTADEVDQAMIKMDKGWICLSICGGSKFLPLLLVKMWYSR